MARTPAEDKPVVSTGLGWMPAIGVTLAVIYPALHGMYWASVLTGVAAWGAIGVWRAVQILGLVLNHIHWRDVEVPAGDDSVER